MTEWIRHRDGAHVEARHPFPWEPETTQILVRNTETGRRFWISKAGLLSTYDEVPAS